MFCIWNSVFGVKPRFAGPPRPATATAATAASAATATTSASQSERRVRAWGVMKSSFVESPSSSVRNPTGRGDAHPVVRSTLLRHGGNAARPSDQEQAMAGMMEHVSGERPERDIARIASDPDVLERFYRAHVEAVQRFVARRVDDPYLAADLTADVFLAAIESAPSYRRSRGEPVAWLFGIARNVVAGEHRRSARQLRATAALRGRELVVADDLPALHERIDAEAAGRALHAELRQLPARERAVLELVALDGLGASEAAHALGISAVA